MSLEEIYSPLAIEILCLHFLLYKNDRGRPDGPQATCSSTRHSVISFDLNMNDLDWLIFSP